MNEYKIILILQGLAHHIAQYYIIKHKNTKYCMIQHKLNLLLHNDDELCTIMLHYAVWCWIMTNYAASCWMILYDVELWRIVLPYTELWWIVLDYAELYCTNKHIKIYNKFNNAGLCRITINYTELLRLIIQNKDELCCNMLNYAEWWIVQDYVKCMWNYIEFMINQPLTNTLPELGPSRYDFQVHRGHPAAGVRPDPQELQIRHLRDPAQ